MGLETQKRCKLQAPPASQSIMVHGELALRIEKVAEYGIELMLTCSTLMRKVVTGTTLIKRATFIDTEFSVIRLELKT